MPSDRGTDRGQSAETAAHSETSKPEEYDAGNWTQTVTSLGLRGGLFSALTQWNPHAQPGVAVHRLQRRGRSLLAGGRAPKHDVEELLMIAVYKIRLCDPCCLPAGALDRISPIRSDLPRPARVPDRPSTAPPCWGEKLPVCPDAMHDHRAPTYSIDQQESGPR
jgi:hypothetical protein